MENRNSVYNENPWIVGLLVVFIYTLVIYINHEVLISDQMLMREFTGNDFDRYLAATNNFRLVKYFSLDVFFIISILVTYGLLHLANSMYDINLSEKFILNISTLASATVIVKEMYIFCWFIVQDSFVSSEVFDFNPLSLFSILGNENTGFLSSYILQSLDVFFIIKLTIIITSFTSLGKHTLSKIMKAIFTSYLLPILILYAIIFFVI